jgi:hypothetical protein
MYNNANDTYCQITYSRASFKSLEGVKISIGLKMKTEKSVLTAVY